MHHFAGKSIFGFLLIACLISTSRADDWPRFRGVDGAGVSQSKGLPDQLGPESNVLWKVEAGAGTSSPIICDGRLYLTAFAQKDRSVECYDAASGKLLWKKSVPQVRDETTNRLNGPATCTVAVEADNVVAFFPDAGLLCYSPAGDLKWHSQVGPFHSMHGIASSPVIADGKIVIQADQLRDSYLAAYDLQSGQQVWKVDRADGLTGGYSTPTIFRREGQRPLILTSGPGGLIAYDLQTGKAEFTVPGISNAPVTLPLVDGQRVFSCEPVGEATPISMFLPRYDRNKDGKLSFDEVEKDVAVLRLLERIEQGWGNGDQVVEPAEWDRAFQSFVNHGGLVAVDIGDDSDATTAEVVWNYRKQVPYIATPVLYDNILYMIDSGGIVTAVDASDGTLVSKKRLRKGGKQFYASPVAADGKIFVIDTTGQLTVLRPASPGRSYQPSASANRAWRLLPSQTVASTFAPVSICTVLAQRSGKPSRKK